jgi:hypothetical protein
MPKYKDATALMEECKQQLQNLYGGSVDIKILYENSPALIDDLKHKVGESFGLTWDDIIAIRKTARNTTDAKHVFCYIAANYFGLSSIFLTTIVKIHPAAIDRGIKKVKGFLSINDQYITKHVTRIVERL